MICIEVDALETDKFFTLQPSKVPVELSVLRRVILWKE